MRKTSADVLNEADRTQRVIDWVTFQAEQSRVLYDGDGWHPGDPLYPLDTDPQDFVLVSFSSLGLPGVFHAPRCSDCEVYWYGDEPCFVCGAEVPNNTFERFDARLLWRYPAPPPRIQLNFDSSRFRRSLQMSSRRLGRMFEQLNAQMLRSMVSANVLRKSLELPKFRPPETNTPFGDFESGRKSGQKSGQKWRYVYTMYGFGRCDQGFEVPRSIHVSLTPFTLFTSSIHVPERRYPNLGPEWDRYRRVGSRRIDV